MNTALQLKTDVSNQLDFSKVHLVHVVRQYLPNIGGLEDVVRNLTRHQKGRFAGLKIVTLNRLFKDLTCELPAREDIEGIEVHRIPFRGSSRYPVAPGVLREIAGADLVHVHAVDFFFDALALTQPFHGRTMVATTHGGFFHTKKFAALKAVWFNTLTRYSANRFAALACCSQSDLQQFQKVASKRARLIENGVDIQKFAAASSAIPVKRVLTLGRFSANKRLDRTIELLAALNAQDPGWHLDIVGIESDVSQTDLWEQAAKLGVADNLNVHIGLADEAIRDLMSQCSFFVSASEYEGFGLALIEAMSAGLVPVVHSNSAFQALASKHTTIELADFADVAKPASLLLAHAAAPGGYPKLRNALMAEVESYGWGAVTEKYDAIYRAALLGDITGKTSGNPEDRTSQQPSAV